jgi:site-specific DNA-cytosine methylase
MNVLSLFDGMSCGQIALDNLGIKVDKYFASEIDKYAMEIAKKNFPDTIHVGNVEFVTKSMLNNKIDLIIGGSPCQGFSRAGKGLNFEDPRSKLFFEFVRLIKECKPKYFMLENVKMNKESRDIISKYLGVEPIYIDSALLSAQTRKRYYWTNIPNISGPIDKGIILKDIIQTTEDLKGSKVDERMVTNKGKAYCLTARYSGATWWNSIERSQRTMIRTVNQGIINEKYNWRKLTPIECERLQTVPDNYTEGVSNSQRYKMLGNGWTVKVIEHVLTNMDV